MRVTATATTIFWGALLLFVVQPLTARRLLPWFGGSPSVWVVSLLFFQTTLLLGYVYAHASVRYLNGRSQAIVHVILVLAALWFLPLGPSRPSAGVGANDPTWAILGMLAGGVGLPLLSLSATNPLMQRWLAPELALSRRDRIFRLFALSNLGSLIGLWCYPFALEPWTSIAQQARWWSYGYGGFAALSVACAGYAYREGGTPSSSRAPLAADEGVTRARVWALWLGLSATGAVLLMATSNQLTRNVAAVPFLWVLPLSLYLVSFIIAFDHDRWYVRPLWSGVYLATLLVLTHWLGDTDEPDFVAQLVVYSLNLLSGAMICHGELARSRPGVEHLTAFYLVVALGGVVGGAAVTLLAPQIFSGYWEYPCGLLAVYVLGGLAMPIEGRERIFWALGGVALAAVLVVQANAERARADDTRRSFFGVVRISDRFAGTDDWERYLWNGAIAHGGQLMAPERRREPILYYGSGTGVAVALEYDLGRAKRVGVIGLGTGTLAAYGRDGDRYHFFEINPEVVDVARDQFYYLAESEADVEVSIGDGRLVLERSPNLELDVLVIDAFTGDAIPVHLLTEEAFATYERHLAPDGIIAVHVSNLHFDLKPVIRARADAMGSVAVFVESDEDEERNLYVSDWMLMTTNAEFLADPELQALWTPRLADEGESIERYLWTDDYANLLGTLRQD
jgi:spermidine synthase